MGNPSSLSCELLTTKELANILKVPQKTIYYWVSRGEIPHMRVGRHLRFEYNAVLLFFRSRTAKASCQLQALTVKSNLLRSLKTRKTGQRALLQGKE